MNGKDDISKVMAKAADKYGEILFAGTDKEPLFKKGFEEETLQIKNINIRRLELAALKVGEILEKNEERGIIIASITAGFMNASSALIVARIRDECVEIAALFREGLIKQNGAKQAIEKLKQQL